MNYVTVIITFFREQKKRRRTYKHAFALRLITKINQTKNTVRKSFFVVLELIVTSILRIFNKQKKSYRDNSQRDFSKDESYLLT